MVITFADQVRNHRISWIIRSAYLVDCESD